MSRLLHSRWLAQLHLPQVKGQSSLQHEDKTQAQEAKSCNMPSPSRRLSTTSVTCIRSATSAMTGHHTSRRMPHNGATVHTIIEDMGSNHCRRDVCFRWWSTAFSVARLIDLARPLNQIPPSPVVDLAGVHLTVSGLLTEAASVQGGRRSSCLAVIGSTPS